MEKTAALPAGFFSRNPQESPFVRSEPPKRPYSNQFLLFFCGFTQFSACFSVQLLLRMSLVKRFNTADSGDFDDHRQ